jgi:hypothetical protein
MCETKNKKVRIRRACASSAANCLRGGSEDFVSAGDPRAGSTAAAGRSAAAEGRAGPGSQGQARAGDR